MVYRACNVTNFCCFLQSSSLFALIAEWFSTRQSIRCLALFLEDVSLSLSLSCGEIKNAITSGDLGVRTSKYFLKIIKEKTDRKRRCTAIFWDNILCEIQGMLTTREYNC